MITRSALLRHVMVPSQLNGAAQPPLLTKAVERTAANLHIAGMVPDHWITEQRLFPGMSYPIEVTSLTNKRVGFGQLGLVPNFADLGDDGVQITLLEFPYVPEFDAPAGPTTAGLRPEAMTADTVEYGGGFDVLQGWWRGKRSGLQIYAWVANGAGADRLAVRPIIAGLEVT